MRKHRWMFWLLASAVVLAVVPLSSRADDDDEEEHHRDRHAERRERGEGKRSRKGNDPAMVSDPAWARYTEECGSCHLAYPPRFLPRASWEQLLGGLGDHFGQNAEVDAETQQALTAFLGRHAGPDRGGTPLRITELPFWRKEHRELRAEVWRRKAVGSKANCQACHPAADQGVFDEHTVKVPRDAPAAR